MPAVSQTRRSPQGDLAVSAYPDRWMRLLHRGGQALQSVEAVEASREGSRALRPERLHDADVLVADRAAAIEVGRAQGLELLAQPAHADAHGDASLREHVDGGEHLCGDHGIPVRHDHDARDQAEPLRLARDESHEGELLEGITLPREGAGDRVGIPRVDGHWEDDVVRDHHRAEAHGLAALHERLERFGSGRLTAGRKVEAVAHGWPFRRLQYLRATLSSGSLSGKREDAIVARPVSCIRE